jgi:CzcA family heavy metal efflux pump
MLDRLIKLSLENRLLVMASSIFLFIAGIFTTLKIPVDVFPDLTAPTVTIMTESHGMAPEEVETLITMPIEGTMNGATGVRRVRSSSTFGMSTVWVEFQWGTDIYKARQVVNEKLQLASPGIPVGVTPVLAPITSIMGEIMYVGLWSEKHTPMDIKEIADFVVRKRLLSVPGVSQVVIMGGDTKQYHIKIDPLRLNSYGVTLSQAMDAVKESNENFSAGVMKSGGQDYLIRGIGRARAIEDIRNSVITANGGIPVLIRDVAKVEPGPAVKVGDVSVDMKPAVLIAIQKHPDVNTIELTKRLEKTLSEIERTLPDGMRIDADIFKQSDFIIRAIDNVKRVVLEGAILVIAILLLFLGNIRTTVISLTAIPLSLIFSIFVLRLFDITINTMTLGGMAIAIGVIVDDAIIDVENVFRRLKENRGRSEGQRKSPIEVVFEASKEIRSSIVNATLIIIVVFLPLFFLSGLEGRLLRPLGISYMVSIGASLIVALTVTPVLCSYLLPRAKFMDKEGDSLVVKWLKLAYGPGLDISLKKPNLIIAGSLIAFTISLVPLFFIGRSFLPSFNEGSLTVMMATAPGTSIEKSSAIASLAEGILLNHPNITKTARRTGRGDLDEHGKPANASEIEAKIELNGRKLDEVLNEIRKDMSAIPGTVITFGQPISHRIDHMLSGTMASIAVKIFGPDLFSLRAIAEDIRFEMSGVEGVVDLSVEQQADISQLRIIPDRTELAKYGMSIADVASMVDTAMAGEVVSKIAEGDRRFDVVVKFDDTLRDSTENIKNMLVDTPSGAKVPLSALARVASAKGPNSISRENVQRKIVVQANVSGRDLRSVYEDIKGNIEKNLRLPAGYHIEYGGQFESEAEAARMIGLLSIASLLLIILILYVEFSSFKTAALVMINLPFALIGGILVVFVTGGVINISSMVGFITLLGIATRNGILLISHYQHLIEAEGKPLKEAVLQGSMERLRPVLMTALSTGLALVPFAIASDKPGNEILSPLALVILGGLFSSTVLNMMVLPSLYIKYGKEKMISYH